MSETDLEKTIAAMSPEERADTVFKIATTLFSAVGPRLVDSNLADPTKIERNAIDAFDRLHHTVTLWANPPNP